MGCHGFFQTKFLIPGLKIFDLSSVHNIIIIQIVLIITIIVPIGRRSFSLDSVCYEITYSFVDKNFVIIGAPAMACRSRQIEVAVERYKAALKSRSENDARHLVSIYQDQ